MDVPYLQGHIDFLEEEWGSDDPCDAERRYLLGAVRSILETTPQKSMGRKPTKKSKKMRSKSVKATAVPDVPSGLSARIVGNTLVVDFVNSPLASRSEKRKTKDDVEYERKVLEYEAEKRGQRLGIDDRLNDPGVQRLMEISDRLSDSTRRARRDVLLPDGRQVKMSASNGNEKTGKAILTWATYPGNSPIYKGDVPIFDGYVGTCAKGVPCAECTPEGKERCYAISSVKRRTLESSRSLVDNTEVLRAGLYDQWIAFMVRNSYGFGAIRFNTYGDFESVDYLKASVEVARQVGIPCLAFTKQFDVLEQYLEMYGYDSIPQNYTILLSTWEGMEIDNRLSRMFPQTVYVRDINTIDDWSKVCAGNCDSCGFCIGRPAGDRVYLIDHAVKAGMVAKYKHGRR
ncbi:MAG: hypothetical protein E7Z63_01115 [Thermoplasmata archaeon]|nr:hypothetical protein [Thermoplasmata archaeon]